MNFLQRLFSQPKVEPQPKVESQPEVETTPSPPPVELEVVEPETEPAETGNEADKPGRLDQLPPGLHVGHLSDVGRERERNEDSFYSSISVINDDTGQDHFGLFIVADGMGGHQKGEKASATAVKATAGAILEALYLPTLSRQPNNSNPLNEVLVSAVQGANQAVKESVPEGGTTLTAALVMGNNAYIAHVGDSRAYLIKQNEIKQITQDHSLAKRLEELGQATADEAAQVQNVLYRALGQDKTIEVDTHIQHLPPGASLLLCSDGLWGQVKDIALVEIFATAATPHKACERLINMANKNGGPDNITAIIVSMGV